MKKRLIGLCLLLIMTMGFSAVVHADLDSDPVLNPRSFGLTISQPAP